MIEIILIKTIKDIISFNDFKNEFILFIISPSSIFFSKGRIDRKVTTPDFKMYLNPIITEFLLKKFKNFYENLYKMHQV